MRRTVFEWMSLEDLMWEPWESLLRRQENWEWSSIEYRTITLKWEVDNILYFRKNPANDNKQI